MKHMLGVFRETEQIGDRQVGRQTDSVGAGRERGKGGEKEGERG